MKNKSFVSVIHALFCVAIIFSATIAQAEQEIAVFATGDKLEPYALEDQHGKKWILQADTERVILSFEMELSKGVHQWLDKKDKSFLDQNNTEYVADITPMPDVITYLFAGPKMRRYPFRIILADNEYFAAMFPKEEGKLTVLELAKDREIVNVRYFSDMEAINNAYFTTEAEETPVVKSGEALANKVAK